MLEQSDIQQVFIQQEVCAPEDVVGCAEVFEQPIGIKSLLMVRPTPYPTCTCTFACRGSSRRHDKTAHRGGLGRR